MNHEIIMNIDNENYSIEYIDHENMFILKGNLRLQTIDKYNEIMDFITRHAMKSDKPLTLDLTGLTSLNSSGIASLSLFLVNMKKSDKTIKIIGSSYIKWQSLSLTDFKELNSNIDVELIVQH